MKIFVVGATGVLGRALMPLLIGKGCIVRAIARTPEKVRALELAGIEALQGDLLNEETTRQLPEMMKGCTTAIHIATAIPRDMTTPGAWDTNTRLRTEGTRLLLQAALTANVQRYVQQSIVMAYPDGGEQWLDETTPLDAAPERAEISKPVIAMEDMVRAISTKQLQWSILRGGNFIGPETMQDEQIAQLRAGNLTIPCDGSNYISLIHVADMASAVARAIEAAPAGSTFNIVDEPLRAGDYLDRLASLVGVSTPARNPAQPCPPSNRCTNQAARTMLDWTPRCGIWPSADQLSLH